MSKTSALEILAFFEGYLYGAGHDISEQHKDVLFTYIDSIREEYDAPSRTDLESRLGFYPEEKITNFSVDDIDLTNDPEEHLVFDDTLNPIDEIDIHPDPFSVNLDGGCDTMGYDDFHTWVMNRERDYKSHMTTRTEDNGC